MLSLREHTWSYDNYLVLGLLGNLPYMDGFPAIKLSHGIPRIA